MVLDAFKELPIGAGEQKRSRAEQIPVVGVDNKVIYLNPDFPRLPFNVKVGEPTNLGIFASQRSWLKKAFKIGRYADGAIRHRRSLILSRAIFADKDGRLYRDVDAKGTGFLGDRKDEIIVDELKYEAMKSRTLGIFERWIAEQDASYAEIFTDLGIRTYRVIAIIKLNELVQNGKIFSIDEAKAQEIIPNESEPVISIRAFGTRDRIADSFIEIRVSSRKSIDDARLLVAQELGKSSQEFTESQYFHWFVDTLAENVALMHKADYVHDYLTEHNITLDCRIVDLDSVRPVPKFPTTGIREGLEQAGNPFKTDIHDAITSILEFKKVFKEPAILKMLKVEVRRKFMEKYLEIFDQNPAKLE